MSRARKHFLLQQPGLGLPMVALVLNVLWLGFLLVELRGQKPLLRVATTAPPAARQMVRLEVRSETDFRVDGEPVGTVADLEFRLGGKIAASNQLAVRVGPGVSGAAVVQVLEACSRAGFGRVSLDTAETTASAREP
jgi:biopolymer transport protein ExbD